MGDAKRRGTYEQRKSKPLGLKSNHEKREISKAMRALKQKPKKVQAA